MQHITASCAHVLAQRELGSFVAVRNDLDYVQWELVSTSASGTVRRGVIRQLDDIKQDVVLSHLHDSGSYCQRALPPGLEPLATCAILHTRHKANSRCLACAHHVHIYQQKQSKRRGLTAVQLATRTQAESSTNIRFLSDDEKDTRLRQLALERTRQSKREKYWRDRSQLVTDDIVNKDVCNHFASVRAYTL